MSRSKRSHEGVLIVDHRFTPGMPDQAMPKDAPRNSGKGLYETPTFTCNHCPHIVVMNPLRTRERAYCRKCDHYICDRCGGILAATGICKPYKAVLDELQETGLKEELSHG